MNPATALPLMTQVLCQAYWSAASLLFILTGSAGRSRVLLGRFSPVKLGGLQGCRSDLAWLGRSLQVPRQLRNRIDVPMIHT